MFRTTKLYPCMAVVLAVICVIFLSNCGGGENSSVVPNTNPTTDNPVSYTNTTPTPVLTNVSVSGYIYCNNITTEDGEIIPNINVLDVPPYQADSSGNEPFITQFSDSLQQDYPEDWSTLEVQELYAQLKKTLSESKPLPEYSAGAQVYSVYDDSSPIAVNPDGHFENSVLTEAADKNVKIEVALGEDNYTEVETIPSNNIISSNDAVNTELKSCPEKIFAFPGEIVIFRVTADGVNLKKAGLKFALDNPSIGCISQPVYLCIFGEKKYQTSYGCLYVKNGLDTPIDTNITATTNSGLSLKIFTEVIKKTASISGTVYTGEMPLVKAKIKSLGPKACSKADENGNYTLQKVFLGHYRAVTCTYWIMENGQKIRHREVKVIDFLNSDVTGFNFGVPPTPTPTFTPNATPTRRPPTDPFYDMRVSNVIYQFEKWKIDLGTEVAIQKTLDWINNSLTDPIPVPGEIAKAVMDTYDNTIMWIYFTDGRYVSLRVREDPELLEPNSVTSQNMLKQNNNNEKFDYINPNYKATTINSNKILILATNVWEEEQYGYVDTATPGVYQDRVYGDLAEKLKSLKEDPNNPNSPPVFDINLKIVRNCDIYTTLTPTPEPNNPDIMVVPYYAKDPNDPNHIILPDDFKYKADYGVVYIATHGMKNFGLDCGIYCENTKMSDFVNYYRDQENELWCFDYPYYKKTLHRIKKLYLSKTWIEQEKPGNSIVFIGACNSWSFIDSFYNANNPVQACIGFTTDSYMISSRQIATEFFNNMIFAKPPKSVNEAFYIAKSKIGKIERKATTEEEIYFPGSLTVTVHKENLQN